MQSVENGFRMAAREGRGAHAVNYERIGTGISGWIEAVLVGQETLIDDAPAVQFREKGIEPLWVLIKHGNWAVMR